MKSAVALFSAFLAAWLLTSSAGAAVLWTEGEKPLRSTMNRHPWWYDQVKREQLSGGDLTSNFNDEKIGEAAYNVTANQGGPYEFWVRVNPLQARLSYRLNGGDWTEIDLTKEKSGEVNIAADNKPDLRFIAWVKAGKVTLRKGANALEFRMHSKMHNHGYLDCFVLANEPFQPQGILKPGQRDEQARRYAEENRGWFAFTAKSDVAAAAQPGFDLRSLNEKVAGEGGFIGVKGSQFVHSRTGEPVRFWAVNGPSSELKDPAGLAKNARLLAKYGVNMIRIHGSYWDQSGKADPGRVKHAQAVVAAMKTEGIYSHFSIYFPLWLTPKPGTEWLPGYDGKKHPFATLYFNKDFQRVYRQWWKGLLLTPDANGRRLVDDPAVAGLELINEDSYFFWTFAAQNIPDPQLQILEKQFGDWLVKKYGSLDAALAKWQGGKTNRDKPAEGRLGFRPLWNMFNERTARDKDTARFLLESQTEFYRENVAFLRELGFRGVITCSNWTTASPEIFGPLEKLSYMAGDFIDRHGYFSSNEKGDSAEWSMRDGHTYSDRSALRFDPEEPGKPKLFVHPLMDPHYNGKPSMISETTFCRPNRYRTEAPLLYAAYGALQASDAIVHFALDSSTWSVKPGFFMQPWTLMSPAMMGQFPAAAILYRQGLVKPGAVLVELNLNKEDLLNLQGTPLPQDAAFDELRLKDVPQGTTVRPGHVIDPLVHFAGRTNVNFVDAPAPHKLEDLKSYIDRKAEKVTSSTGQLALDYGRGVLAIRAPAAQGLLGNLRDAGSTDLGDLVIASDLTLGSIVAVSLDGQPLADSRRILLQVMSEEKNGGFQTEAVSVHVKRITSIGQDPWMVKELRGTVQLKRADAARLQVTALDHSGEPLRRLGTAKEIRLAPETLYYLITP